VKAAVHAPAAAGPRGVRLNAPFLLLIRLYRATLSPVLPRACRFHPSCSEYAEQALRSRPLPRALWLIVRRLARCHPFHPGGFDPLP